MPMLSLEEMAERLSVSRETIKRLIIRGELKGIRIGRQYRVTEEDFQEYLRKAGNIQEKSED